MRSQKRKNIDCIGYLRHLMPGADLRTTIRLAKKSLRPIKDQFDAIAVRGVSGLLSGPILALALNKGLIVVRKDKEPRHSHNMVEGDKSAAKYVIVDDLIDSGETVKEIIENVYRWSQAECIGVLETYDLSLDVDEPVELTTSKGQFDLQDLMRELKYGDEITA